MNVHIIGGPAAGTVISLDHDLKHGDTFQACGRIDESGACAPLDGSQKAVTMEFVSEVGTYRLCEFRIPGPGGHSSTWWGLSASIKEPDVTIIGELWVAYQCEQLKNPEERISTLRRRITYLVNWLAEASGAKRSDVRAVVEKRA